MKIYTESGDRGKTSLFSGERLSKASKRVEAYGDVDELNSVIGLLVSWIEEEDKEAVSQLRKIQSLLFDAGARLAVNSNSESASMLKKFSRENTGELEQFMDGMEKNLPSLQGFILPGGSKNSALAHMARTICRRAERHVISALEASVFEIGDANIKNIIIFLNRLSDYFFILARHLNRISGVEDQVWKK